METLDIPFTHELRLSDGGLLAEIEVTLSINYVDDADWRILDVYRDDWRRDPRDGLPKRFLAKCPKFDPLVQAIIIAAERCPDFAERIIEYAEDNDCRRRVA